MATKPPKGNKKKNPSSAYDPLNKWSNDPEGMAKESIDATAAFQQQIVEITAYMNEPSLKLETRRALYRALAEAKKGLAEAKANTKAVIDALKGKTTGGLAEEATIKLKDLKEALKVNKDPYAQKYAKVTQDLLEQLIDQSKDLGKSEEDNEKIFKLLKNVTESLENLPEEFTKRLDKTTEIFDSLAETLKRQQEKQQEDAKKQQERREDLLDKRQKRREAFQEKRLEAWTTDYEKAQALLTARSKELKGKFKSFGMEIANRIGFGAFSVGGAIRGVGNTINFVKRRRELSAAKNLVRTLKPKLTESGVDVAKIDASLTSEEDDKTVLARTNKRYVQEALAENKRRKVLSKVLSGEKVSRAPIGAETQRQEQALHEQEMFGEVKDYVTETREFHRKVLQKLDKGGARAGKDSGGGIADSLVGGLTKFFTGAALSALMTTIASKIPLGSFAKTLLDALRGGPGGAVPTVPTGGPKPTVPGGAPNPKLPAAPTSWLGKLARLSARVGIPLELALHSKDLGETPEELAELAKRQAQPWTPPPGQDKLPPLDLKYPIPGTVSKGAQVAQVTTPEVVTPVDTPSVTPVGSDTQSVSESDTANVSPVSTGSALGPNRPVSTGTQLSESIGKTISLNGSVNTEGLSPSVKQNLKGMADEYYALTGNKLPLNSAFRSLDEQEKLYRTKPPGMAAPPGKSMHNYGFAFDTNSPDAQKLKSLGLLAKYGFDTPLRNEPWHVQPRGITLAAARSGIFTADQPIDQGTVTSVGGPASSNVANTAKSMPVSQSITPAVAAADKSASMEVASVSPRIGKAGSMGAPSQNSVKDIPTFDQSDGMFLAMNLGIA